MQNILYVAVLGLNQSWDASQLGEPKAVKSLAANFYVHVINGRVQRDEAGVSGGGAPTLLRTS